MKPMDALGFDPIDGVELNAGVRACGIAAGINGQGNPGELRARGGLARTVVRKPENGCASVGLFAGGRSRGRAGSITGEDTPERFRACGGSTPGNDRTGGMGSGGRWQ